MKRDPSIHVKESDLLWALRVVGPCKPELATELLELLKARSITRFGIVNKAKNIPKAEKLTNASRIDADVFAQLLTLIRKQAKHRGIQTIKPNSRDWAMIKDITSIANEFQLEFGLSKKEAYTRYIKIAMSKMSKFSLMKFTQMTESIFAQYQSEEEIKLDDNPQKTAEGYTYYQRRIIDSTGVPIDYSHNPDKYLYFYKARLEAERYRVPFIEYLKAQFEGFEWANKFPDPIQLVGDKAIERLSKYVRNNRDTTEVKVAKVGLKNILNIK